MSEPKNPISVTENAVKPPFEAALGDAEAALQKEREGIPSAVNSPELDLGDDDDDFPEGGTRAWMVVPGVRLSSELVSYMS